MTDKNSKKEGGTFISFIKTLFYTALVVAIFKFFIFNIYSVPTGSMIPTVRVGDEIVVSKLSYGFNIPFVNIQIFQWSKPKRGDVVAFRKMEGDTLYIKRVIGVGGDTILIKNGEIFINNVMVRRDFIKDNFIFYDISDRKLVKFSGVVYKEWLEGDYFYTLRDKIEQQDRLYFGVDRGGNFAYQFSKIDRGYKVPKGYIFVVGDNRDSSNDSRYFGAIPIKNVIGKAQFVLFSNRGITFNFNRFFKNIF